MGLFQTTVITLKHGDGTVVQTNLPVQMDISEMPWDLQVQGMIPTDLFDVATLGWTTPVPIRSDYIVDQATNTKYSVFSTVFTAQNSLQFKVTKYSNNTA